MKIIIVYRDFWPDNSPYAQILFKIAKGLAASGHDVSVLTSFPSHSRNVNTKVPWSESINGIKIRRLPLLPEFGRKIAFRLLNTVLFLIQFSFILLFRNARLVMVASTPPVVDAAAVRIISHVKRYHYLYHCQDIHPEALLLAEKLKKGFFYNLLRKIDKQNVSTAAATVVLSQDMQQTLIERGIGRQNIHVINNFIFDTQKQNIPYSLQSKTTFTVLFAGNLGQFQGLERIIDAAKFLEDEKKIHFIFLGEGIERKGLEKRAGKLLNSTVFFKGHRPLHEALTYMHNSDLGLISINPGVLKIAYPSKTMMYLSEGLPVLILAEPDSSLAKFIQENHLGYVCQATDSKKLAATIKMASQNKHNLQKERNRIKQIAYKKFGEDVILSRWSEILNDLEQTDFSGVNNNSIE